MGLYLLLVVDYLFALVVLCYVNSVGLRSSLVYTAVAISEFGCVGDNACGVIASGICLFDLCWVCVYF